MIIEILNGGEIQALENTEYIVFADSVFVLPASQTKNTIKIKVSGLITIGLKFTYPNENQKTIGVINGKTYKPESVNENLVYNFTLEDQTEMELKCYKRAISTYWTPYITEMPLNQGIVDDPIPQPILLGLVDPNNINTTDDIPEGINNLYFTEQRARDSFSAIDPITLVDGEIGTTLTQYTDEDARNAAGIALQTGTHTGISFVNADAQDKINATVSLSPFSIGNLGDVQLGGLALQNNHFLKYSGGKWVNSTLNSTNLSDINTLMKKSDNLAGLTNLASARTNLGLGTASTSNVNDFLSVGTGLGSLGNVTLVNVQNRNILSYDSTSGKWTNRFLASSDIPDINKTYAPINNPTFTGSAKSSEPLANSNDNTIATTGWVRYLIQQAGGGGGATQLNDLSDVQVSALQVGQVLRYDGNKFVNTKLAISDLNGVDGLLKKNENLSGLTNLVQARSNLGLGTASLLSDSDVLTKDSPLSDLSDITFVNLQNNQVIQYDSTTSQWTNSEIKASDIQGLNGVYAPINSPTFTGIPIAPSPANNSNSNQIPTTAWVKARISEGGGGGGGATSLNDLNDVSIDDLAQVDGQTLRFNGVEYVNTKLASTDLSDTASILLKSGNLSGLSNTVTARTNLGLGSSAILDAGTGLNQVLKFTAANVLPAVSGANLTALGSINLLSDVDTVSNAPANGQFLSWNGTNWIPADGSSVGSINDLSDVDITGIVNGQFLKWDGTKFVDHTLVVSDLSDSNTLASQTELDTTQASLGLNADGSRPVYSSTFYILNTDSHHTALGKLDTQVQSTQTEVDNIETSLGGYINANGIWVNPVGTNYLNATTSFSNALSTLDSRSKTNADDIALKLDSASYTANDVLTKIKTVDGTGSGLDADLLDGLNSDAFVQVTSLDTIAGHIEGAIPTLDANGHIKFDQLPDLAITHVDSGLLADRPEPSSSNTGDVYITTDTFQTFISSGVEWLEILNPSAVSIENLQSELDDTQLSLGLNADGSRPVYSSIHYILNTDSHHTALGKLDTQVKTNADNIDTNATNISDAQDEIDQIEASLGLEADGTKSDYSSTNYILNVDSHHTALGKLDAQLFSTQSEVDLSQLSLGLNEDGTRPLYSSNFYILDTDSHNIALGKLDTQLFSTQSEIDTTQLNLGFNEDGTRPVYSSENYILNTDTHHIALGKLDTQVKTNADNIALKLDSASYTAEDVFNKVLSLDGSGSGLNADLLDGFNAIDFVEVISLDSIAGNVEGAIPTLDVNGHIKADQLPDLAITHVDSGLLVNRPAPSDANTGDVYITTDTFQTFISSGTEWLEILNPSAVSLVEIQSELDTTQSNLGLNGDGSRPVYSSTHYIDDIDTHHTAIGKLDNALWNLEDNVNNLASTDLTDSNNLPRLDALSNTFSGDLTIQGNGFATTPNINSVSNEIATAEFVINKITQSLLVDDQGRFIEVIDYGSVTDNLVTSSLDFQDANGDGETPLNAEDLFLSTIFYSIEDYGCLIG